MVIFKEPYNIHINKNKNGSGSYSFSYENYKAGLCGSGYNLSYNRRSNIPQGDPTYDAARKNMGEPWKMFTKDQGWELIKNTFSGWTTANGVNGYKFFNKTDFSKYIFLPAAGEWGEQSLGLAGEYGYYLSTKYVEYGSPVYICRLQFYYDQYSTELTMYQYSYVTRGASVRGIRQ